MRRAGRRDTRQGVFSTQARSHSIRKLMRLDLGGQEHDGSGRSYPLVGADAEFLSANIKQLKAATHCQPASRGTTCCVGTAPASEADILHRLKAESKSPLSRSSFAC